VVEDNAHGLLGKFNGKYLGTFGCMSTLSFHETKNFTCGEGGALLINDPKYIERAEIIREKGTNRSHFFRGQVDKYTWVDIGSSYLPSDLLAAYLCAQLEARETVQARRRTIWDTYHAGLAAWAAASGVGRPCVPAHCEHPAHLYHLLLPSLDARTRFLGHLRARSILATFHYQPLHLSDMGRRFGGVDGQCPVTEDVSERLVRLPFYFELGADDQARVLDAVTSFPV
jgi:dTDP-4-amino-4,6-dideoxygalactose transaminase